jgi:hypothetical protein
MEDIQGTQELRPDGGLAVKGELNNIPSEPNPNGRREADLRLCRATEI